MDNDRIGWGEIFSIWWAFMWRTTLLSLAIELAFSFLVGVISALLGMHPEAFDGGDGTGNMILLGMRFISFVIFLVVSYWMMKVVLNKQYKRFRINLSN
ncbi:MAG TPA: hypothetical protein VJB02_04100 [Coxiellaceae bacterium]|nr:hypothetical protein [Coxiellaceae bacterium]